MWEIARHAFSQKIGRFWPRKKEFVPATFLFCATRQMSQLKKILIRTFLPKNLNCVIKSTARDLFVNFN
jgi:hypothetical protein